MEPSNHPATSNGAPSLSRLFSNLSREHGFEPLRVEGQLPAGLEGTLYRNGLGRAERYGERYGHWFDGDGAVTAVRLAGGKADGAIKLVKTRGAMREARAGRALYGGYNTPMKSRFREVLLGDRKNPSNTSVMLWQSRLFAICEAGLPYEIDRADLATLGERDLGAIALAFSAHPHEVRQRNAIYNFGLARFGPRSAIEAYELPRGGRARALGRFDLPGPTLVHDFAATEKHLVFVLAPFTVSMFDMLVLGHPPMDSHRFRPEQGTEIVVMPIDAPDRTWRTRLDAFYSEHTINAYDDKDAIVVDLIRYDDMRGLERYVGKLLEGYVEAPLGSSVARCTIDTTTRRARIERRFDAPCELPRVSPNVEARPHRFVYLAGFSSAEASRKRFFDAVLKLDVDRGSVETWPAPQGAISEPVFVPRRDARAEDDGHVLTLVYDAASGASHLAILDGRAPSQGPVARAHFDHAIPPGFHGVFSAG